MTNTINLGTALSKQGKLLPALQAQEQALATARQMGLPKFELFAEVNLAVVEITLFRFEAALRHSIAATELADRQEHELLRGLARALQARSLVALGNPGAALALAEEAERILRKSRYHGFEQDVLAYHLTAMAQVWQLLGDCRHAARLSLEAVDLLPMALDLNRPHAYLGLSRCAARGQSRREELEHLRRARCDLTAWRTRTGAANSPISRDLEALLDAATYEAQRALDPETAPAVGRSAYGFALLRQLDGENAEALRSLLAVPAASPDFDRAQEFAEALRERVRIVEGAPLELRESPTAEAALLRSIDMGSWVEVLGEAGAWRKLRYLEHSGFADLSDGRAWLREAE